MIHRFVSNPNVTFYKHSSNYSLVTTMKPKANTNFRTQAALLFQSINNYINPSSRAPSWEADISKVNYLLTPWSRVLLEKLTGFAASQEIPRIYGTLKFITVLTSACHLSLSWARSIQSPQPPPTFWRFILILSSHLRLGLPNGLLPWGFPTKTLCTPLPPPYAQHNSSTVRIHTILWNP
jgi:hypothetical protein